MVKVEYNFLNMAAMPKNPLKMEVHVSLTCVCITYIYLCVVL